MAKSGKLDAGILPPSVRHPKTVGSIWPICAIVLLSFAVECIAIRGTNLGLDGGLSLALGIVPLSDALRFLAHDVHPPLYYVALRGWLGVVGAHPFAVKYLGLGFATFGIAAFMAWIRRFLGLRAAARAGLLLALSPILVGDAATVRDLAPGVCFVIVNCWAYCEARRERKHGRWTNLYVASGILAIWTSFLTVGVLIGQAIHLGFRRWEPRLARSMIVIGLTIVPWGGFALAQGWLSTITSGGPTKGSGEPSFLVNVRDAVALLVTGSDATRVGILIAILCIIALALGPSIRWLGEMSLVDFAGVEAVVTLIFALGVSSAWLKLDVPSRYLAPVLPFWLLLVVALAERAAGWKSWFSLATILAVNLTSLNSWYRQPALPASFWNPTGVQAFLDQRLAPDDHIVFLTLEQAGYYAALSPRPHPWTAIPVGTNYLERNAITDANAHLTPLMRTNRMVWLVEYRGVLGAGQRAVDAWLARRAYPVGSFALSDSVVHPYLTGASLGPDRPLGARFTDGVKLDGVAFPATAQPGEAIPIRLLWHVDHPLARDLTVFVHLVDQRGQTIAQQDVRPVDGLDPTTQWQGTVVDHHGLIVPSNAPTGNAWIEVGLYDASGRLSVQGRGDGAVRLGPIAVER